MNLCGHCTLIKSIVSEHLVAKILSWSFKGFRGVSHNVCFHSNVSVSKKSGIDQTSWLKLFNLYAGGGVGAILLYQIMNKPQTAVLQKKLFE